MSNPMKQGRSFSLRLKVTIVSLLSLIVTTACSLLRTRPTPEPTCYTVVAPNDTPTPVVMCYEATFPTDAPTPTPFTSPLSPLPTPTPTSTPEARHLLLERLLAEGRLPPGLVQELGS